MPKTKEATPTREESLVQTCFDESPRSPTADDTRDARDRLTTADVRPPRPGGRVTSLVGNLATYYGAYWRFGILGRRPITPDDIEMWCLFAIAQHFCFNPGHPNFRRTAHMY